MSVLSKHTSTNLEALDLKIARLLRDPSEIFEHVAINVDAMTMTELKDFAENGNSNLSL
jgi:hypothetical protein